MYAIVDAKVVHSSEIEAALFIISHRVDEMGRLLPGDINKVGMINEAREKVL